MNWLRWYGGQLLILATMTDVITCYIERYSAGITLLMAVGQA